MFQIIKQTSIKFTSYFKMTAPVSIILVLASLFLILTNMQYGVDFRGGAEVQVKFSETVGLNDIRKSLSEAGYKAVVQTIGEASDNEALIKVQASENELNKVADEVGASLKTNFAAKNPEIRKIDIVGPKAGAQLRLSGFQAMFYALIAIMIYIGLRFDFKYSPGAIVALFHDVTIILGVYSLAGIEFTLQTVAALLAVIGYSVNDTVIVYDRVREHEQKYAGRDLKEHIDNAVNETLSRTILTSSTTLFVSAAMFFFGGAALHDFFTAITLGVIIGTYSSIFVAAPVTLILDRVKSGKASSSASGTAAKSSI
ncbi:MAG: protein translocase subunit SecF [Bacteriovoracaceae bacterium]